MTTRGAAERGRSSWFQSSSFRSGWSRSSWFRSSWLPWLLIGIGVLGLLLPWLLSPVTSDERYHYAAAPSRMNDNVLNVVPWTINDMRWRMRAGRIAPIGVFVQHVIYLLGMQFSFSTGLPLFVVHGIVKVLLLVAMVGSFWLLLRQLRHRDGTRLSGRTQRMAVLLFSAGTVLGIEASSPARNGWTTFIVLCLGGVVLMFLTGTAALWVLHRWPGWGLLGRTLAVAGLVVLGAAVVLSYELHWAAVPFAIVLVAFLGRSPWWSPRPQPGDRSRLWVVGGLGVGFLVMTFWTRAVIAANQRELYVGLKLDLGTSVLKSSGLQLLNAVPGTGIPLTLHELEPWQPTPYPFAGTGWLWGLLLGAGLLLLLRRQPTQDAQDVAADRHPLLVLAGALAVSAVAAALVLSVSVQAHSIVSAPGDTYRGTPWIWSCLAGIVVAILLAPRRSARARRLSIILVPAIGAVIAGAVVWPYDIAAIQTQRTSEGYVLWEQAQAELVNGSGDPIAVAHRCQLQQQAVVWAGTSAYQRQYLPLYRTSFQHQWGRPWCS